MTVFEVGDRVRLSDGEEAEVSAVGNDWAEIRYDDGFYGVKLISDLQSVAESLSPDEAAKPVSEDVVTVTLGLCGFGLLVGAVTLAVVFALVLGDRA